MMKEVEVTCDCTRVAARLARNFVQVSIASIDAILGRDKTMMGSVGLGVLPTTRGWSEVVQSKKGKKGGRRVG